jgi:pyruvate dehydrogenase E1 component beta subunit
MYLLVGIKAFYCSRRISKDGILVKYRFCTVRPLNYDAIIKSVKKNKSFSSSRRTWPFASVASSTYMFRDKAFDFLDAPVQRI